MTLGKFMKMVESMLGSGKFQIAGEAEIFDTKAEIDAVLYERGEKMEPVWFPASDVSDSPEWASKCYYLRSRADNRRIGKRAIVFAE